MWHAYSQMIGTEAIPTAAWWLIKKWEKMSVSGGFSPVCVPEDEEVDLKLKHLFVFRRIWNKCVTHDYVFQGRIIPL